MTSLRMNWAIHFIYKLECPRLTLACWASGRENAGKTSQKCVTALKQFLTTLSKN